MSDSPHLGEETDPISETLCFLAFRIPDAGHIPECYTPQSEPRRFYFSTKCALLSIVS
jgi:hypothetical protein